MTLMFQREVGQRITAHRERCLWPIECHQPVAL